jgi:hypothetical protein
MHLVPPVIVAIQQMELHERSAAVNVEADCLGQLVREPSWGKLRRQDPRLPHVGRDPFPQQAKRILSGRSIRRLILTERDRAGSVIMTSNRGADEWLATFAAPVRTQAVSPAAQAEVSRHQGWTEEGGIGPLIRVMRRQEPRGGECS